LQVSFEEAQELVLEYGINEDMIRTVAREGEGGTESPKGPGASPGAAKPSEASIKLKSAVRGAPSTVDRHVLEQIVFERSQELMTMVRQYLHSRGLAKHLVRGMVLTGGAASIKNQAALADAVFQVPARVGLPEGLAGMPSPVNAPEFSAVVGVAKHGAHYRNAVRSGRVHGRGGGGRFWKWLWDTIRRYFF
jgi:cell division ATPase FtsA